jgi:phosphoglycolate phosphatase
VNLFIDLDGTLIDSKLRLYRLFQYLVIDSEMSYEEYWELKRNKIDHKEILKSKFNYTYDQYISFQNKWMTEIELKKWLDLDVPFIGVTRFLEEMSKKNSLYIVTARQSSKNTLDQLNFFNWGNYFTSIFITEQKHSKVNLVRNNISVTSEDWFIGDTGKDIETGKKLGIKTAAVLSGFLNEKQLIYYKPDIIIDNIINFKST